MRRRIHTYEEEAYIHTASSHACTYEEEDTYI
jgi:hypothetical protein